MHCPCCFQIKSYKEMSQIDWRGYREEIEWTTICLSCSENLTAHQIQSHVTLSYED